MNERIREIWNQAASSHEQSEYSWQTKENFMNRFAELIVRECIDIVSPYAIRMENFDGGHPIDDLKKHFGVE